MAPNPKEYVRLNTRIDQWQELFNDITNDVGDLTKLTTGGYVSKGGAQGRTDSAATAGYVFSGADSDIVTAINEVDYRLDSIDDRIDQFVKTSSNVNFNQITVGPWNNGTPTSTNPVYSTSGVTTTNSAGYTIDASLDIILDADGANVTIMDNGVTQFDFSNNGTDKTLNIPTGNLIVTTGTDIILRPTGDTVFMQGVTSGEQLQFELGTATQTITASDDMSLEAAGDIYLKPTGDDVFMQGITSGEQLRFTLADATQTIAASDALSLTATTTITLAGTDITLDASGDVILDADGADVILRDGGVQYAAFTNNAGNLIVKSGSTTAATFTGADVSFASNVYMTDSSRANSNFSIGGNLTVGGNTQINGTLTVEGAVNFKAGTSGTVTIGDANTDNVVFNADINSSLVPNTNNAYNLGSPTQEWQNIWVTGNGNIDNLLADSATITGDLDVQGITTLDSATVDGALSVTRTLGVTGIVTANAGVKVDNITIDGTEIDLSSGDFTLDVAGDINLDADGGDVILRDGGTEFGRLTNQGTQLRITSQNSQWMTFTAAGVRFSGIIADSDLVTTSKSVVAGINELSGRIDLLDSADSASTAAVFAAIGDLNSLTTTAKSSLVAAVNEINNGFDTRAKGLLSAANSGTGYGGLTYSTSTGAFTYAKVTDANIRERLVAGNAITYTSATGTIAVTSDAIEADELAVTGNGTSGQALISDGDGTFSWGRKVPNVYDSAGSLLN